MSYRVEIPKRVEKDIKRLPSEAIPRVLAALYGLREDPRPPGCLKLEELDQWRIRVGRYQIIYEIHDAVLLVVMVRVGHRKDVYRDR